MDTGAALRERLGLRHPIIQGPMAGGGSTPALAAAAGRGGGLGFLAGAYLGPAQIREAAAATRALGAESFGVNLFVPRGPVPAVDPAPALARIAPLFAELGLAPPAAPPLPDDPFADQFAAVLESGATAFSFTFGLPPEGAIAAAKARGMAVLGTATTVAEAVALERAGVDAVVAQGSEAGGHRGTFAAPFERAMIGTMALVPQVADAVSVPVVASGGIMDGRGIAAALALGAAAVQLGTAFLVTEEAGVPQAHKAAVRGARPEDTRLTRAYSGRPARGIVNRGIEVLEPEGGEAAVLPFPLQNDLTRPLRTAAGKAGRAEFLSLWAGQGLGLARPMGAEALVARLAAETAAAIGRLRG